MKRALAFSALLPLVILLAGCGDSVKTAVVKGRVTFKDKPVPNGTVTFMPQGQGPPATGEIQPDGTYRLMTYPNRDGAVLGKHVVVISAVEDTSHQLPEQRNPLPPSIVPDKYTSVGTTDLKADVEDKENIINFDLKGEKRR